MSSTLDKVKEVLATQLDIDVDKIEDTTDIAEDLGADSLDVVELMFSIEEEYNITIDEEQIRKFKTVADVAKYIDEKI
ncbi:MAG: acyl carrier protein [Oscillospiraceae bacterium]|nr:acyl carrier protein [Oscillospiraceae bacterium]